MDVQGITVHCDSNMEKKKLKTVEIVSSNEELDEEYESIPITPAPLARCVPFKAP